MILSIVSFLRTLLGLTDFVVLTLLMYVLSLLPNILTKRWYRPLFRYWCWVFIRALRVELHLLQQNLKPLPKHYILIGNHPSAFEDIGMSALFDARFLAKIELRSWWILGRISRAAGTYYVERGSKDSRQAASAVLQEALAKGINVGIYPEGGCKGRRIAPFQWGAFHLSQQTGVPIIPVFLHYEAQADFEWLDRTLPQQLWRIFSAKNKRVNYYVFDALEPREFATPEIFCNHVQKLYVQWQQQYLE